MQCHTNLHVNSLSIHTKNTLQIVHYETDNPIWHPSCLATTYLAYTLSGGLGTVPTGLLNGPSCMCNKYDSEGIKMSDLPFLSDNFPLEWVEVFEWVSESASVATTSPEEEVLRLAGELVTEGSEGRTGLLNPGMMPVLMS